MIFFCAILIDNNNPYSSLSFLRHIGKINLNYLTGELSLNKLDYYEIGKRIRKCQEELGLTQEAAAEQCGISPSFYSDRKKALEIKDFFITKYRFFQNRTLSYRPISIFFSCCCISRLTPATGLISGFYQFLPGALIAFFVVFFNRAYTGAIRIMEFL